MTAPDTQMHDDRIAGLEQAIKDLRSQEALFIEAQGLDKQAEKATQDSDKLKAKLDQAKADLKAKLLARAESLGKTADAMAEAMGAILPDGQALFDIEPDGNVLIGWQRGDVTTPYAGLSGGQKVIFDAALAHAMKAGVIVIEGAEMDDEALLGALAHIGETNPEAQIIVNTWDVEAAMCMDKAGFETVNLEG